MNSKLFTRNFILLIFGQVSSLFGNTVLRFALSMYILDVTGSATVFASLLAFATIPTVILAPFGGILADRANRRNIMVALDALSGIIVTISFFVLSDNNAVPAVAAVLIALSILQAFESPTVQACVPLMQTGDNIIKGNAVVNQVTALAGLIAPIAGSVLYTAVGLHPILLVSLCCFFLTAFMECFIKLPHTPSSEKVNIIRIVKDDFSASMRFIGKERPDILKVLLLAAAVSFFVVGVAMVGMPYIIRTVLGLNAGYFGAAESVIGVAAIAGSIVVGLIVTRFKIKNLYLMLASLGVALIPGGVIFLFDAPSIVSYLFVVISMAALQFAASIFSIFALSIIQQGTPNEMIGRIMAYVATISMCAQPFGQIIYGILFDSFHRQVGAVLLLTAILIFAIGMASKKVFLHMDEQKQKG